MPWSNWHALAKAVAEYVQANSSSVRRGTVRLNIAFDNISVGGYFGNDDYGIDSQARRDVERLRQALEQDGDEEFAFGLSEDGRSWALLIRRSDKRRDSDTTNQASLVISV